MTTLVQADFLDLYRLLSKTRALHWIIAKLRQQIFGVVLLGIRQESVSVVPMFALLKMGILLESIKSGDHRTITGIATVVDELTCDREGHNHVLELLRNHFGKATGGNRGRDGNIHVGCLPCRVLDFMSSDMGRVPGMMLGYAEEIARLEYPSLDRERRPVGVAFFGEGAFQQGGIYEGMNLGAASNFKWTADEFLARFDKRFLTPMVEKLGIIRGVPYVYIVVNNQKSLFADAIEEHGRSNLALRAAGFGDMVGVAVDADNPPVYYGICEEAFARARNDLVSTLIIANTYRGAGHNQSHTAYKPDELAQGDLSAVTSVTGIEDMREFHKAWETEPLKQLRRHILGIAAADESTLDAIDADQKASIEKLAEKALAEPDITLEEDKRDRTLFPSIDWSRLPIEKPRETAIAREEPETPWMGYNQSFRWIVRQLMREDSGVVYFGEDVAGGGGGVLGLTGGVSREFETLAKEFGPARIWNSPLSEEALLANGAGRSLFIPQAGITLPEGYKKSKPILEIQFMHFIWDGLVILRIIAPQWYLRKLKFAMTIILPFGPVPGSGEWHESSEVMAHLMKLLGIVVAVPSNAYDVVGLMRAAYEYDGPVAMCLQIGARNEWEFARNIPPEPYVIPFGKASVIREGTDFTVVAYGANCVAAAKNEADYLKEEGVADLEVIDLRTAWPFDLAAIKRSFFKTGRLAILQEDTRPGSIGSEIVSTLLQDEEVQAWHGKGLVAHTAKGLGFGERLLTTRIHILSGGDEGDLFAPNAKVLGEARLPYETARVKREHQGKPIEPLIHRSARLAAVIREGMGYR